MASPLSNQTLALAGVFQAAGLVNKLAKTGTVDSEDLSNSIKTILNLNPESYDDAFNGKESVHYGLGVLKASLAKNGRSVDKEVLQYAMAIIAVQGKLVKRSDLMDSLSKGLDRAVDQQNYFNDFLHEAVLASTANCYQSSVSKLSFRIRVTGNPQHLQNPTVADKVRTLLLYGVRSALLWRQAGGRRWHFMTNRQQLHRSANHLLDVA